MNQDRATLGPRYGTWGLYGMTHPAAPRDVHGPATDPVRLALALWLVLGIAVSVRTLISPVSHSVFPIFSASAVHWWNDQPLYAEYKPLDKFRYPPVFAVGITPLSYLGLRAGGILWSWLSIAVFVAGLWYFARDVLPAGWSRGRVAALLALGALGALRGLWNAQSNALVVGLLLLGASLLVRRRWWAAAFLLALPVWVKVTPLAVVLLLCALWPRRLAGRLAVALAVGLLLPFLTRPPAVVWDHYREWVGHLTHSSAERWPGFRDGWTVWLVLRHLIRGAAGPVPIRFPITSNFYRTIQVLAAAGALAWCLWQQRRGASAQWLVRATLGIGLAWLMLFGPAVEHATYVFLTPPLLWAFLDPDAWPGGRVLIRSAFVLVMFLGWGLLVRKLAPFTPLPLAALPLGTALFTAWLLGYALQPEPATRMSGTKPDRHPSDTAQLRAATEGAGQTRPFAGYWT